jgi:hypothetical protein
MKENAKVAEWCDELLAALGSANPDFEFLAADLITRRQKRKTTVRYVDLIRRRTDGLFDRVFLEFEYFDPPNNAEIEPLGFTEFGWLLRFQYAINKHTHCAIPCIREGFYCNLFDLTEFAPEYEELLTETRGNYHLGKDETQFAIKFVDLAAFLAISLPLFCESAIAKKIRPQQVGSSNGG